MHRDFTPVERLGRTNVIWEALAWTGYEHLCLEEWSGEGGFTVDGLVISVIEERPSRTWYRIEVDEEWDFLNLRIFHTPEFSDFDDGPIDLGGRNLELVRSPQAGWDHDLDSPTTDLADCKTIDIAVTPFTNTLAIRLLDLQIGETADIDVVFVTVPALTVAPASQRYSRLSPTMYRYENPASGFRADLTVDSEGLVVDYPGLFRRVWP